MNLTAMIVVLCCAALAQSSDVSTAAAQSGGTSSSRKQASEWRAKASQARPDEGSVSGDTYTEKFFHLSCTIPNGWVVKTAKMREGVAAQENSILLLSAFAKENPAAGEINSSLTITAESLATYPDVITTADYFAVLSQAVTSKGFTVLNEAAEIEVGGVTFLRGDFQKEENGSTTYQASMVTIRNGYVLAITAISANDEELTPLLSRVRVMAPPSLRKP